MALVENPVPMLETEKKDLFQVSAYLVLQSAANTLSAACSWSWDEIWVMEPTYQGALQKSDCSLVVDNSSLSTTQWKYDDIKVDDVMRCDVHVQFRFRLTTYPFSAIPSFSVMDMASENYSPWTGLRSQEEMGE
jgi:hypothetical protein